MYKPKNTFLTQSFFISRHAKTIRGNTVVFFGRHEKKHKGNNRNTHIHFNVRYILFIDD